MSKSLLGYIPAGHSNITYLGKAVIHPIRDLHCIEFSICGGNIAHQMSDGPGGVMQINYLGRSNYLVICWEGNFVLTTPARSNNVIV